VLTARLRQRHAAWIVTARHGVDELGQSAAGVGDATEFTLERRRIHAVLVERHSDEVTSERFERRQRAGIRGLGERDRVVRVREQVGHDEEALLTPVRDDELRGVELNPVLLAMPGNQLFPQPRVGVRGAVLRGDREI